MHTVQTSPLNKSVTKAVHVVNGESVLVTCWMHRKDIKLRAWVASKGGDGKREKTILISSKFIVSNYSFLIMRSHSNW